MRCCGRILTLPRDPPSTGAMGYHGVLVGWNLLSSHPRVRYPWLGFPRTLKREGVLSSYPCRISSVNSGWGWPGVKLSGTLDGAAPHEHWALSRFLADMAWGGTAARAFSRGQVGSKWGLRASQYDRFKTVWLFVLSGTVSEVDARAFMSQRFPGVSFIALFMGCNWKSMMRRQFAYLPKRIESVPKVRNKIFCNIFKKVCVFVECLTRLDS